MKDRVDFFRYWENDAFDNCPSARGLSLRAERISATVVDVAFHLHCDLGPGLMESVYEVVLAELLRARGPSVVRQHPVPIEFSGLCLDEGFRVDLLIEGIFLVELKAVEQLAPVHHKQLLTYLRLMHLPLGLLINFGAATFKEGVKRIANGHHNPNSRAKKASNQ